MNHFKQGDVLLEGAIHYRKTTIVPMVKMNEPFLCDSREGTLGGQAGDFLVEDSHGGFYPISAIFHAANYEDVGSIDGSVEVTPFLKDIQSVINQHSAENASTTPDFILARYLGQCLKAFDVAVQQRETWYGRYDEAQPSETKN